MEKKQLAVGELRVEIWIEIFLNPNSFSSSLLRGRTTDYRSLSVHWPSQGRNREDVSHLIYDEKDPR